MIKHFAWTTKYRYNVLDSQAKLDSLSSYIEAVCQGYGVTLSTYRVGVDWVHVQIDCGTATPLLALMNSLKGQTSFKLMQAYADIKTRYSGKFMWNKQELDYTLTHTDGTVDAWVATIPDYQI